MSESTDNIFNMTFDDLVGQVSKEGENLDAKQTEPKTEEKTETEPKTEEKTEKTAAKEFKPKTKAKEFKPKAEAKEFKPKAKAKEFKPQTDSKKITNAFDAPATSSKPKETDDTKKRTAQYEVDTADVFGNIEKDPVPQDEFSPLENSKAVVDPNEKPAPHAKVFGSSEENATVANKTETKTETKTEKRAQSVIAEVKEDNMAQKQNDGEVVVKIKVDRKILDLIDQKDLAELVKKSTASLNDQVKKLAKESFDKLLG